MIHYPPPLIPGSLIGVTGPSGGVVPQLHPRLELAERHLEARGFRVREGRCLRDERKHVSGSPAERAADFQQLWDDPGVQAIIPPWGGDLLVEMLPRLDLARLAAKPKWCLGWSDTSTLLFAITVVTDVATAHGTNLMDQIPDQTDPLTRGCLAPLMAARGATIEQHSSERFQRTWSDPVKEPEKGFQLTEPTRWRVLGKDAGATVSMQGRLIGGCIDTIGCLLGTPYGDLPAFIRRHATDGIILYLENCAQPPCMLARLLWGMRLAGWMSGVSGVLIGRSTGPAPASPSDLNGVEALESALGDLEVPVVYDADIGHQPPQMTLVNGALAEVHCEGGRGRVRQTFG